MSNHCEHIRPMLLELEYGELDSGASTAVHEHLEHCDDCRGRLEAFRAVRTDLSLLEVPEPAPSRITFVAMQAPSPRIAGLSPWTRGLAAAASFAFGLLLVAAFTSTEISRTADGWSLRTGLWGSSSQEPVATPSGPQPVERLQPTSQAQPGGRGAGPVTPIGVPVGQGDAMRFMSQDDLDTWLDGHLQRRGFISGTQPVSSLGPEEVQPILEQLMQERDAQWRGLVSNMLAASEVRQREELSSMLVGVYEAFDAQRTNDLLFLASELGLLQESTGLELQRTNAAIDYLITRAAEQRQPEERDDD